MSSDLPAGSLHLLVLASLAALAAFAMAHPSGVALPEDNDATSTEAFDRTIETNVTAIGCPEGYDNGFEDDVCLAFGGQVPGPTWVLEAGQRVELTLEYSVAEGLEHLDVDPVLADRLAEARYSLHRHGVSVANCDDGVSRPLGTRVCDSSVGPPDAPNEPAGSVTYNFTARFAGPWHYHDHAKGVDVGAAKQPVLGPEAVQRGLFGSFLVLEEGEETDHVFDLHLLDRGANAGAGLDEHVDEGDRFDILVTGLENWAWTVQLDHDEQGEVAEQEVGPGVSRVITVEDAQAGTYIWTATSPRAQEAFQGEVSVG